MLFLNAMPNLQMMGTPFHFIEKKTHTHTFIHTVTLVNTRSCMAIMCFIWFVCHLYGATAILKIYSVWIANALFTTYIIFTEYFFNIVNRKKKTLYLHKLYTIYTLFSKSNRFLYWLIFFVHLQFQVSSEIYEFDGVIGVKSLVTFIAVHIKYPCVRYVKTKKLTYAMRQCWQFYSWIEILH